MTTVFGIMYCLFFGAIFVAFLIGNSFPINIVIFSQTFTEVLRSGILERHGTSCTIHAVCIISLEPEVIAIFQPQILMEKCLSWFVLFVYLALHFVLLLLQD